MSSGETCCPSFTHVTSPGTSGLTDFHQKRKPSKSNNKSKATAKMAAARYFHPLHSWTTRKPEQMHMVEYRV